jgi:hypothetical protein
VPFPKTLGQATYTAKNGKQYKGAAYPVYEFVFDGVEHLWCQVDRCGTAEVFPDLSLGSRQAEKLADDHCVRNH